MEFSIPISTNRNHPILPPAYIRERSKWDSVKVRIAYGLPTTLLGCFIGGALHFFYNDYSTYTLTGKVERSALDSMSLTIKIGGILGSCVGLYLADCKLKKNN